MDEREPQEFTSATASRFESQVAPSSARCTVVVPCYNEAARLRTNDFVTFLQNTENRDLQLLFVNDGSRDATLSVLQDLRSRFPARIRVLDKQPNGGKAEAVRHGMLHALSLKGCEITGFWDADLATPLEQIPDLEAILLRHPQLTMVFGARVRLLGRAIQRQPLRHYLGRCFATTASTLLRLPIYDTQCGAKLFRVTPELTQVLAAPFQSRWIFDVELLARFSARHRSDEVPLRDQIYEYPLPEWTDVAGSKVGSLDFFKAFGELFHIYQRYLAR
ncbi:glycosyltransferase [Acidipila sp. EB88]|uniref:glycosyltransferase n=1 Tax=Acidipila sp. EB88 TaxID=2305226 RepID=UPI000F5FE9A3|nr:glycosyltransferase [Acidipila sp. EB88]RRA48566.1 glycosyltransferase [Acidipila sp. EB88]